MNRINKPLINRGLFFAGCEECLAGPFKLEVFKFPRPTLFDFDDIIDLMLRSGYHPPGIFSALGNGENFYRAKTIAVSHAVGTSSEVHHHEGHEEHEGRKLHVEIRLSVLRVLRALRGELKNLGGASWRRICCMPAG